MKKKYVVAFLATLFFILAISIAALVLAQGEDEGLPTAESLGVEDASGEPGTYVEVPVNIANIANGPVQGIRLRVDYDESVLNLTKIGRGDLTSEWTLQLGEGRHTIVTATAESEYALSNGSSGSVVLLNFTVIGSPGDTSPMNLTLIELSNLDGEVGTAPARNGTFTVTSSDEPTPTPTPTPTPSTGDGGGDGNGGYVPTTPTPTPTPTEKPPAILGEEIPSPTLAPTVTPLTATPAQTPAPTIPAAQVPVISWSIILIAIFISVIIVLTGYLLIRKMS